MRTMGATLAQNRAPSEIVRLYAAEDAKRGRNDPAPAAPAASVADIRAAGIPMFIHTPGKHLHILVAGDQSALEAGQELLGLIDRS